MTSLPHEQLSLRYCFNDDGSWTHDIQTQLMVKGRDQAFDHFDTNTLKLVEAPSLILAVSFINGTAHGPRFREDDK